MFKSFIVFKIRIVYKSGYFHDFEVKEFHVKNGRYVWEPYNHQNKPIDLGSDEIAAVYQVGARKVYKFAYDVR